LHLVHLARRHALRAAPALLAAWVALAAVPAPAATPPAGGPMAQDQHPRLAFTASDLPGLRDRIQNLYATEFQDFIDLLADPAALTGNQQNIENSWGSLNFAFVAALDPAEMATRGFSIPAAFDTPQEACGKAYTYAATQLSAISSNSSQGHSDLTTGYPSSIYLPVLATYDWCYPYLSSAQKTAIVDAFVSAYNTGFAGQDMLSMQVAGLDMMANNQSSANLHGLLGITAFYGDPYPAAATQQAMYDDFYSMWIDRVLVELNYFYGAGYNWHEGPGGYHQDGYFNLGIPIAMFSRALGTDYIGQMPFFNRYAVWSTFNMNPHTERSTCGSGSTPCIRYADRWGTISGGVAPLYCKTAMLNAGMLRMSGHANAGLARWVHETLSGGDCDTAVTEYGGPWAKAVLMWFLWGDRDVTPKAPSDLGLATAQELGMGQYVMKSGFGADDSRVLFWASPYDLYGHDTPHYGSFTLAKYGNLILMPGNSKSGDGLISGAKFNLMTNAVGIHKGASDPTTNFDGGRTDPFFAARGLSRTHVVGQVFAKRLTDPDFDYVGYDDADAWDAATADVAQREFVSLRGPENSEYLVLFDRVRTPDPAANKKAWKVWVPTQPTFVNGSPSNPQTGMWVSTDTDTMRVTNQQPATTTSKYGFPATHGRFFLKTLAPSGAEVRVLGGPGKEFQSGDDDGSTPWGSPTMSDGIREYLGWGRIEVVPTASQAYDTFLNVIEYGDSATLTAMAPTTRVTSSDGALTGAHVGDAGNQWVVLFAQSQADVKAVSGAAYTFHPVDPSSRQLLLDMQPSTNFYVSVSSGGAGTTVTVSTTDPGGANAVTSDAGGVLRFDLNGLTVSQVQPDTTPPAIPTGIGAQISG